METKHNVTVDRGREIGMGSIEPIQIDEIVFKQKLQKEAYILILKHFIGEEKQGETDNKGANGDKSQGMVEKSARLCHTYTTV